MQRCKQKGTAWVCCFLLMAFCSGLGPLRAEPSYAGQARITLDMKNATLEEVFRAISQQSEFEFFYSTDEVDVSTRVTVSVKDALLEEVMGKVLPPSYEWRVKDRHVLISVKTTLQAPRNSGEAKAGSDGRVHGRVVDTKGEPLPGVSIIVKGQAKRGTSTNTDGEFIIKASSAETLVFSCISMKPREVPVSQFDTEDTVVMEDDNEALGDAVVVGYGLQKKVSIVGAISTVNMNEVMSTPTSTLSAALVGRVPGLVTRQISGEPGSDQAYMYIRGLATWGDNSPIVIVDGIERDINLLTMQEVESITFLKDATATAVYGIRGANGVIIVTTKHGQPGRTQVKLRSEGALLVGRRFPDFISSGEYSALWNEACINDGKAPTWTGEDILRFYDQTDPYTYPDVNWIEEIFKKTTYQTNHNATISGGTDKTKYYVNIGFFKQNGLFKSDPSFDYSTNVDLIRYNLRTNIDFQIVPSLTAEVGLGIISKDFRHPVSDTGTIFGAAYDFAPNKIPIRNPDGSFCATIFNGYTNPYMQATHMGYSSTLNNTFNGTFSLKWDLSSLITKGLRWTAIFAFDQYGGGSNARVKHVTSTEFTGIAPTGEDEYKIWFEKTPETFSASGQSNRSLRFYTHFNYDRTFGRHNLSGMLMYNMGESLNVTASNGTASLPARIVGVSGRAVYDFENRYILEASFGYNGSENFAPGHRFGFFPGVAVGWNLAKEPYWKWKKISTFKFRGSVGLVGNDRTGGARFTYLSTTTGSSGFIMGNAMKLTSGFAEGSIGASDISWEKSRKINLGWELGLFADKLTVTVDAFRENRDGLLVQRSSSIPLFSGIAASQLPYVNYGQTLNRGFDSAFEYKNTTSAGFYYDLKFNLAFNRSKVLRVDQAIANPTYSSSVGHPLSLTSAYIAEGFFEDEDDIARWPEQKIGGVVQPGNVKYRDVNGDGVITYQDRVLVGYPSIPEINYGFGFTMGYRGFDWSLFFQGCGHCSYFFFGKTVYPFVYGPEGNVQREFYEYRWRPGADNSQARYPRVSSSQNDNDQVISTLYMREGAFLRLKNAEIGYTLPTKLLDRIKLTNCRFFVNGVDLFLLDRIKITDPETNSGNMSSYPRQSTFNAGVDITF